MTSKWLKIAGALLYVCEGTKLRKDPRYRNTYLYSIELTNSDPKVIKLFMRFLLEYLKCDTTKVRGQLFVYEDHNIKKLMRFWSKASSIPTKQFQKVIILKSKNSKYKPNPLGTFKIRYSGKFAFLKLQSVIDDVWKSAGVV